MAYSFGAQIAEVSVDPETGFVTVERIVVAHDVGRAINPQIVEGQIDGQVFSGMSQVLYEEVLMEDGQMLNPSRLDYKMPRSTDVPDIKVIDIITDDPDGPFGAKEASEGSIVSTPPALVDALHDATGIWFKELPVTPEKIVKALKEKGRWPL